MTKIVKIVALLLVDITVLCSCANNSDFNGGVLLDSNKLSEIRAEVFATEAETAEITTVENTTEVVFETKEQNSDTTELKPEYNDSTEDAMTVNEESAIVYWTKDGKVWHSSRDCRYIKNSEVESGTANDAIAAGKERVCSSCGR